MRGVGKIKKMKEILIQDVHLENEIIRFEKFNLYQRDAIKSIRPLYFCPYFTEKAAREKGILYISQIVGILIFNSSNLDDNIEKIKSLTKNQEQSDNWIAGVKFNSVPEDRTYYFLDSPLKFSKPIYKADGKEESGKNWILKNITKNRCVSFLDLLRHIPNLIEKD